MLAQRSHIAVVLGLDKLGQLPQCCWVRERE